jgi:hypothetical protein
MVKTKRGHTEKATTTTLSQKEQRKNRKKQEKDQTLVHLTSEEENSDSSQDNNKQNLTGTRKEGQPTKKYRLSTENDMETDLSGQYTSSSLETSSLENTAAASSQTAQITKSIDNHNTRSPSDPQITNSGNSPLAAPISQNNSLSQQQRINTSPESPVNNAPDPSRSRHDPANRDFMEDDDDEIDPDTDVAFKSDVIRFRAAVSFSDVIRDKETKAMCKNRLKDYFITKYTEDFVNLHLIGPTAIRKVILIFATAEARTQVLTDKHNDLKQTEEAIAPTFHMYDPAAISTAIKERTLGH